MSTLQTCFYFRWLTRRHLHVSAKIATDAVKLVEPPSDPPKKKRRKKKADPDASEPKKNAGGNQKLQVPVFSSKAK